MNQTFIFLFNYDNFNFKRIFLVWFFLLCFFEVLPQQYNFSNYSIEHGLAQSQVYAMYEDSRGYLWIGTDGGISLFDGVIFTNFTANDGLSNNQIRSIFEDSKGNMWFGTKDAFVCKFNGIHFKKYSENNGLGNATILAIIEDNTGRLWFGTQNGLYILKGEKFCKVEISKDTTNEFTVQTFHIDRYGKLWIGTLQNGIFVGDNLLFKNFTTQNGLCNNSINDITEDIKGNIWFATNYGVSEFDGQKFYNYYQEDGLCGHQVTSIMNDKFGNIWLGYNGKGASRFNGKEFLHFTENNGLYNNIILGILQDRTGNIWFSTNSGICKFDSERFKHITEKDGLNNSVIMSVCEDKDSNYWFGTYGNGVCKYDGKKIQYFNEKNGLCHNIIYCIFQDISGKIWFGSKGGGLSVYDGKKFTNFNTKNGLTHDKVYSIIQDNLGNIIIGTMGGGLSIYNGKTFTNITKNDGLSSNLIYKVFQDSKGNIFLGTDNVGADMIFADFNSNKIIENKKIPDDKIINFSKKLGMSNNMVLSITQDKKGNIWFGTFGGGICRFNGTKIKNFSMKDGLNSNNIYMLLVDSQGFLWVGTEKGLNRVSIFSNDDKPAIKTYGKAEGFRGIETNLNSVIEDSKGFLWFGTVSGVTQYCPSFDHPNTLEPQTRISEIKLFLENTKWEDFTDSLSAFGSLPLELTLPYDKNHLTFKFIGIDLKAPEKVRYQWILEGFDTKWSPPSYTNEVIYSYIPFGEFTFKVKACNNDGIWTKEPISFHFVINPPFWRTWWFYSLFVITIVLSIYSFIRLRLKSVLREKNILEEKVELRTNQLLKEKDRVEQQAEELRSQTIILEKLSIVASKTANAITIFSRDGEIEFRNDAFKNLYKDIRGEGILEVGNNVYSIINDEVKEHFINCIEKNQPIIYFEEKITNNSEKLWLQTTLTPITGDDGTVSKLVSIDTNITQTKLAEEKIRQQSEKLEEYNKELEKLSIVASKTDNAIIIMNEKGDFLWVNESFSRIFEYSLEQIIEKSPNICGPNTQSDIIQIVNDCIIYKKTVNYVYLALSKSKKEIWVHVTLTPILDTNGNIKNLVAIDTDITELKRIEEEMKQQNIKIQEQRDQLAEVIENLKTTQNQLVESEKMASLANLIAGVAHEINTPVSIGITASSLLIDATKTLATLYEDELLSKEIFEEKFQTIYDSAKLILNNLNRAAELVTSFKQVSVDQASEQKREFDLKEYIISIIKSLKPEFRNNQIEIRINCDENIVLNSYPGTYAQIFTNLLLNSKIHAFSENDFGLITIGIKNNNNHVILDYRDDGKGASKETLEKIFEPFFTTNKQKGSGLGMHIVYNLITQKLNGKINCDSIEGKGIHFLINIPLN